MDDPDTLPEPCVEALRAVTLATSNMAGAVHFYETLGFHLKYGGPNAKFSSFSLVNSSLNLIASWNKPSGWWGRLIFYVTDVDGMYRKALASGLVPVTAPRDGDWGERYFHIVDPDGHELSFARPLAKQATFP